MRSRKKNPTEFAESSCASCRKEPKSFKSDFRQTNASLHMYYVKMAIQSLAMIDRHLKELHDLGRTNMLDVMVAIEKERDRLVMEDAAFFDAAHLLDIVRGTSHPSDTKFGNSE